MRDVLVNLSVSPQLEKDPARTYAISLAKRFDALLTAVAFARQILIPAPMFPPAIELIETANRESEKIATDAIEYFQRAALSEGIRSEARQSSAMTADAASTFGRIARCYDLSVVSQPIPDAIDPDELFFEAALFDSGRPVILVPSAYTSPARLNRILCCWDGSREAARSIADSMEYLRNAESVLLYTAQENDPASRQTGFDMMQHLKRHGVNATSERGAASDTDVAEAILSCASDFSADLIVMGGYGHSRFREFILGGVTRTIVDTTTAPILFAH